MVTKVISKRLTVCLALLVGNPAIAQNLDQDLGEDLIYTFNGRVISEEEHFGNELESKAVGTGKAGKVSKTKHLSEGAAAPKSIKVAMKVAEAKARESVRCPTGKKLKAPPKLDYVRKVKGEDPVCRSGDYQANSRQWQEACLLEGQKPSACKRANDKKLMSWAHCTSKAEARVIFECK